ncbi:gp436 family protein [Ursidibacter arcticus]
MLQTKPFLYATPEQFIARVGEHQTMELTDRRMLGVVDEEVLLVALEDSSSQIEGYLARYRLPLADIPRNLTRICCDLARYRLCSMSDVTITDEVIERYKISLAELKQIAKGEVTLGIEAVVDGDEADNSVLFSNGNTRVFSRDHKN